MDKENKLGKYIAIGAAVTLTLCIGALIIAKKCDKCKNID